MTSLAQDGLRDGLRARPLSVEELAEKAGAFEYNAVIPLRYWLRTADTLQKEAAIYERDGNDQQSYFLLLRHALLILDHLSKHPESKQEPFKTALVEAHRTVRRDLGKLETLKPVLDRKYQKYVELADRDRRNRQKGGAYAEIPNDDVFGNDPSIDKAAYGTVSDSRLYGNTHALQPGQHRDLAVKIHTSETRRRHTARNATRLGGEEERDRRQGGVWDGRSAELNGAVSDHSASGESYRMIRDAGRQRDSFFWQGHSPSGDGNRRSAKGQTFSYPNVPRNQTHPLPTSETNSGPVLPPKVFLHDRQGPEPDLQPLDLIKQTSSTGPALPDKVLEDDPSCQGTWSNATSQSSDLNTSSYSFVPSAYLEDGTPLRTVFLPPSIRKQFLRVAEPNTRRNLETCAFLCGTLISNALFVSKLVIPEQVSTSDTCEMTNEAAFFDYCDMEDLMVLGWIHTHPSQTCFMSSRDLHTHAAYQAMMAESIAIVCAPSKDPSFGIFRLTDPPGMKVVLNCRATGIFHPHAVDHLYTDALKPGHVLELPGLDFELVDMRKDQLST